MVGAFGEISTRVNFLALSYYGERSAEKVKAYHRRVLCCAWSVERLGTSLLNPQHDPLLVAVGVTNIIFDKCPYSMHFRS